MPRVCGVAPAHLLTRFTTTHPHPTHQLAHLYAQLELLTNPALAYVRAKAAAGEVPDPTSEGLAADGTPLFPTLAEQGVQPNQLRVMELASNFVPGKVLRGNNTRLQRFGGNKAYVVEVLPEEEELPQQSCLLYVQRRHPNIKAQAKAFEAVPDGSTPPKMVAPKLLDFALSTTGGCRGGGGGGGAWERVHWLTYVPRPRVRRGRSVGASRAQHAHLAAHARRVHVQEASGHQPTEAADGHRYRHPGGPRPRCQVVHREE